MCLIWSLLGRQVSRINPIKWFSLSKVLEWQFFLSIVDLQCCVSSGIQQSDSVLHIYIYIYSYREGNGTPLQYSCLENPMDGGAW